MGRKPNQQYLSKEMEPQRIKEIEDAADELAAVREHRIQLGKEETDWQAKVVELMIKHHIKVYKYDGRVVTLEEGKTKAKIKDEAAKEEPADKDAA